MNINSHQFFVLLGEADSSYLAAAHKSMTEKPARARFRPALIAACLTLILVAIPVGIMIGNRTIKPTIPVIDPSITDTTSTPEAPTTTCPPQTTEKPKASVLDIPGATLFDENDKRFVTEERKDSTYDTFYSFTDEQKHEWAYRVKEENEVVVGYVKDYTSVLVPDGKDYYRITTMKIAVLKDFSGIDVETVNAVYANRYEFDSDYYYPATKYIIGDGINEDTNEVIKNLGVHCDMFQKALICTNAPKSYPGLILLKDAKDSNLNIGEDTYHLSDYADYVLDACLMYDKELDRIDLDRSNVQLGFRSGMLRELFFNMISFDRGSDTPFFYLEDSYEAFDRQTALHLKLWKANGIVFYDSVFYDDLFIENEDSQKLMINPEYTWVVTIDGVKYEIKRFDLADTSSATTIYLDLGSDFSFELFEYNENNQYTYENVRLDIYDSEGNLLCYSPLTNNYRCPGGYTHTKPN